MTHYSDNSAMVRVDFFKQSGKWYTTEAVKWTGPWSVVNGCGIYESFAKSLRDHFKDNHRLIDMSAVCLTPYHEHEHPIQIKNGEWYEL